MSEFHNKDRFASDYAAGRLSGKWESGHSGNDRLSMAKQMADAELRGKLGSEKANKLIGALDEFKYGYNRYK